MLEMTRLYGGGVRPATPGITAGGPAAPRPRAPVIGWLNSVCACLKATDECSCCNAWSALLNPTGDNPARSASSLPTPPIARPAPPTIRPASPEIRPAAATSSAGVGRPRSPLVGSTGGESSGSAYVAGMSVLVGAAVSGARINPSALTPATLQWWALGENAK